ncbi:MAG: uncharacterized protein JWO87_1791 [Phycisphaerales bacterium]|nr:uncharacterized protein [Phycisphaerales bacterium]
MERLDKARLYAAYGIPDYWIINLKGKWLEVRRQPIGTETGGPQYGELRVYFASETLAPLTAPHSPLKVAD